jgi:3-hydroxyisobutyryl-CoA hydrolase
MASMAIASSDDRVRGSLHPNGVGVITIDRPNALNAANKDMVLAIHELLKEFSANPACR